MASKHFENKARQSFWQVHIEAWQRSGIDRTNYCRQHGLTKTTLDRWIRYLAGKEVARKHTDYLLELRRPKRRDEREKRIRRRQKRRYAVSKDVHSRAVQASWAMHVEAMNWSGMSVREYAAGLQLSPTSLKKWRDRFDDGEVAIDWLTFLHPSGRPKISTGAKDSAKDCAAESGLTAAPKDDPRTPEKQTRRSFSADEKLAIVLETEHVGETVSSVARRHGIVPSMLFRWRADLGGGKNKRAKLAAVKLADGGTGTPAMPLVLHDLLQPPDDMVAVELGDGRRVFAPIGSEPETVRQHVQDQEAAR